MKSELEKKLTRCPRLGHEITFAYCFKESGDLPCLRIVPCWSSVLDIETLLQKELPPDVWQKFVNFQPKDKITSILELISAAKAKQ